MRRFILLAGLLVLGSCVLGATMFRDQIASAGGQRAKKTARRATPAPSPVVFTNGSAVSTGNTVKIDSNANSVKVTNTDSDGNVKVHEQGTANVNVTNSSLPIAQPAPVASGGYFANIPAADFAPVSVGTQTATALSIGMTAGVSTVIFRNGTINIAAAFVGPAVHGSAAVNLGLTRPITFDAIECVGSPSDDCQVDWTGASP